MNRQIIPKVKKILNNANIIAKEFDDVNIKPEHITLSIIKDGRNKCVDVFTELKIDVNALYDAIYEYLRTTDLTPRIGTAKKLRLPPNNITQKVFNSVDNECEKMGDNMIDSSHLMLSIIINNTSTTKILFNMGIDYKSFKKKLQDMKDNISNQSNDLNIDDNSVNEDKTPKKKTSETVKTPVLDNFCRDITKLVEQGKIDPIVGREKEIKRVSIILSRRTKHNPVLIGAPGTGKCFSSDTQVIIRNDVTGEVIKIKVNEFIKHLPSPE